MGHHNVVERHFTELVDDDQCVGQFGLAHQMVEQGGLAAAQEARQQAYWDQGRRWFRKRIELVGHGINDEWW